MQKPGIQTLIRAAFAVIITTSVSSTAYLTAKTMNSGMTSTRAQALRQYYKGNFEEALRQLRSILSNQTQQFSAEDYAALIFDLAQALDSLGHDPEALAAYREAEAYCEQHSGKREAFTLQVLQRYAKFLEKTGNLSEAGKLREAGDFANLRNIDGRPIGTASVKPDGTVELDLRARAPGIRGRSRMTYQPDNSKYDEIILHLGALKPGEHRLVLPWKD